LPTPLNANLKFKKKESGTSEVIHNSYCHLSYPNIRTALNGCVGKAVELGVDRITRDDV
jgi:hypothetical protein